jgi:glycosyltransferase involved in cell wall biosynthesis
VKPKPAVSVVIPTWNRFPLLAEAVESVRAQSFRDFELIVVDDGSEDETPLLAKEPDIRYLRIEHSGMPGAVRNRGVEAASGKYIAFLDSDDLWRPNKLALQVPALEASGRSLLHSRELWLRGERGVSQKGQRHTREGDIFSDALWKCTIGPSTVLMERGLFEELGGFDETLEVAEDYEFWLRLTSRYQVAYLDEALTVKRAGEWDQLSTKYGQIEEFRIESLFRVLELDRLPSDTRPEALAMLEKKIAIWSIGARKRGREDEVEALNDRLGHLKIHLQ